MDTKYFNLSFCRRNKISSMCWIKFQIIFFYRNFIEVDKKYFDESLKLKSSYIILKHHKFNHEIHSCHFSKFIVVFFSQTMDYDNDG